MSGQKASTENHEAWNKVVNGSRNTTKQPAMIDTLTEHFDVTGQFDTPASTVADLGSTRADETVVDCLFRQAVAGVMWLAGMTRSDIGNAAKAVARHSHNPRERH